MSTVKKQRTDDPSEVALQYFPPVQTHFIESKHVKQTFKIQVMQPVQRRDEDTRFPVIYLTDANLVFDLFKGMSQVLQSSPKTSPRYILVGISYPGDSPIAGSQLRLRDLIMEGFPKFTLRTPVDEGVLKPAEGSRTTHGACDFQEFIENELVPFVDDSYATCVGNRTYFGHSAGAQFGLFTLFTKPDLFKNYIVSSTPMIFHGVLDGVQYDHCEFLFDEARRFIRTKPSLDDVKLYMSVGTEEEFEFNLKEVQMTSSFYKMAALLKTAAIPGLTVHAEALAGETHLTAWPISFVRGVQAIFGIRIPRFGGSIGGLARDVSSRIMDER